MEQGISLTSRVLLSFFFLLLPGLNAVAGVSTEKEASLRQYFNKCASQLHSADVLQMADTLYNRASQLGDKHFQVIARSVVLDYYYFQGNKDKILQLVDEVKRMSREYNELESYYFVWGSRLITFYLKSGLPNHALLEAQNMLHEAQSDNYLLGIAECYKAMANIYLIQSNPEQAALNFQKLIEIAEKEEPVDINLPVYYYSLAENQMQVGRLDEAEKTLNRAEDFLANADTVTAYQRLCLTQGYLKFYIKKGDDVRTKRTIDKIEQLFASSDELSIYAGYLRESQLYYYMSTKEYDKALTVIDSIRTNNPTSETNLLTLNKKGDIYWEMNDRAAAAEYYRDYIYANDSIRKLSMQKSADEIAGLFNLRQLEHEKQQLLIDIQDRRLKTTYWAIGTLIGILIIAALFIIHIYRLNRQLKESKQVVVRQNSELLQSSEELRKAKDRAEDASQMKTQFIQNITHEVRTPLNAIVGFSQVLVEFYQESETEEFASLITVNSSYLLRLFNDVLELSNIDQVEYLPYDVVDNINSSCTSAIDGAKSFVKSEVELTFHPSENEMRIYTNPSYVTLILDYLLHNAAKFTQSGSIILDYAISPSEGVIQYSVTDTGIGIPVGQQEIVFERFKKLDNFSQGSGLGLSIARAMATKLGGTLCIDTEYTAGCRFVLTLPFIPA